MGLKRLGARSAGSPVFEVGCPGAFALSDEQMEVLLSPPAIPPTRANLGPSDAFCPSLSATIPAPVPLVAQEPAEWHGYIYPIALHRISMLVQTVRTRMGGLTKAHPPSCSRASTKHPKLQPDRSERPCPVGELLRAHREIIQSRA